MLTLDVLEQIRLTDRPLVQMAVAQLLRLNYRFPPTRTDVRIENVDAIFAPGPIYLAMNHTDRYNYFRFQERLWRQRDQFTATWVKGKYYNNPVLANFMVHTDNIPTPSKGYVITADAVALLGRPPSSELYRLVRHALDAGESTDDLWRAAAAELSARDRYDLDRLTKTPRDMLGLEFDHRRGPAYVESLTTLFGEMMESFVALNEQAFDLGLKVLVFPEGTRSRRLGKGRPGLAQMAVRTGATIVPIGCSGADRAYPGDSPISRGGEIVYRVGEPLTPSDELADFQVDEEFRPFTREADRYADSFAAMTRLVMDRIDALLDPEYRRDASAEPIVGGARRFV